MTDEELYAALGISHYAEGGQVSDQEIQDFYAANRNDPEAIRAAMEQYGVDQNRASQLTGYDFNPQQSTQPMNQAQVSDQQIQDFYGQHKDWTQEQFLAEMQKDGISQKRVFDITGLQFDADPKAQIHSTTPPSAITGTTPTTPSRWQQYIDANPDLKAAGVNTEQAAFNHWNNVGKTENWRASGLDGATQSNPWSIDAKSFHDQVDPFMQRKTQGHYVDGTWVDGGDPVNSWRQNGGVNEGMTLTLSDGRKWVPAGGDAGVTFHPATAAVPAVGGADGHAEIPAQEAYYEVSGDIANLDPSNKGGDQKVSVRYKQVGDQMVPIEAPQYQGYAHGAWNNGIGQIVRAGLGAAAMYTGLGALTGGTSAGVGAAATGAVEGAATGAVEGAAATGAAATGTAATTAATGPAGWMGMNAGLAANATNSFIYSTGRSLATGHNLGDAVTSGLKGAAVTGLGSVFTDAAGQLNLPSGQAAILGNTGAQLLVNGKEQALNAFITGETSKGLETVFGKDAWAALSPSVRNGAVLTASSVLQGRDPTPALINIAAGAAFSQVAGDSVSKIPGFGSLNQKGQDAVMAIVVDSVTNKDSRGDVFNLIMSQAEGEVKKQRQIGNVTGTKTSDSGIQTDAAAIPTSQVAALEKAGLVDTAPPVNSAYINDIVSGNDKTKDSGDHSDSFPAVMLSLGYVESDRMPGLFMSDYGFWVNSKGQFVNGDKEVVSSGAVGGTPLTPEELEAEGLPPLFDPLNVERTENATSSSEVLGKDDPTDPDYGHEGRPRPEPTPEITPAPAPAPAPAPRPTPTPTPTPKPATQQQQQTGSSTTEQSIPIALAKLGPKIIFGDHVFNTQDLVTQAIDDGLVTTPEELLKFIKQLDTNDNAVAQKEPEETNPIYAAQGGSIDDLIEYLRS